MEIVSVQFQSKTYEKVFTGREYSYIAGLPLEVGDIVSVPTKNGAGVARVTKTNVLPCDVGCPVDLLKTITAMAETNPKCGGEPAEDNNDNNVKIKEEL